MKVKFLVSGRTFPDLRREEQTSES